MRLLEDFVKEYICMEQDIHIDDMQESVMQYGRMRKKIEDTYTEISILKEMQEKYGLVLEKEETIQKNGYFTGKLEILELMERAGELTDKAALSRDDLQNQERLKDGLDEQIADLTTQGEELLKRISSTGYEDLKTRLESLNELMEHLNKSEVKWHQTAERLNAWIDQETTSNQTIWDI